MSRLRSRRAAATLVLAASIATACTATTQDDETSTLRVGLIGFSGYAPLYVMEEQRVCRESGVDVELVESDDQSALDTQLASGRIDIGAYANTSLAFAAAAGIPARAFLTLDYSTGADGVVARDDVRSIADLARSGAPVALDDTDVNYFFFMAVAERNGFAPGDFNHVQMPAGDGFAAFAAGDVAAAGMSEPLLSRAAREERAHVLFTTREEEGIVSDVFAATEDTIERRRDDLASFADCWFETLRVIERDEDRHAELMAERLGVETSEMDGLLRTIRWPDEREGRAYLLGGELRDILEFANDLYGRLGVLAGDPVPAEELITDAVVDG